MKFNLTNNEPFEVIRTADDKNVDVLNLKTSDLTNDSGFANWPIVQDKRTSAVDAITADAPFATLTDGQRVTLHLKQDMVNSSTLNLTLSGGTTTGAKSLYASYQSTALNTTWDTIKADTYIDLVYEASNNRWVLIGQRDTNSTYSAMTQAEITDGTATTGRTITPSMLRNNFYTETEIDTLLADKENKKLVVNLTLGLIADKTYTEITTAISEERIVIVNFVNQVRARFVQQDSDSNRIRFIGIANGGILYEFMVNSSDEWTKTQTILTLMYDNTPTENSDNIVTSGAIYTALTQVYNNASTLVSNNTLKYTIKAPSSNAVSFTTSSKMLPNTVYVVGSVSSSTLSFTAINSLSIANESLSNDIAIDWSSNEASITNNLVVPAYQILFKASSSFSPITLPSSVKWKDRSAPASSDMQGKMCELTIMNDIATINIV